MFTIVSNTTPKYVPAAATCRVCIARTQLLRKADRLDTIAAGYADVEIKLEIHASAEADRARAGRVHCIHHDNEKAA